MLDQLQYLLNSSLATNVISIDKLQKETRVLYPFLPPSLVSRVQSLLPALPRHADPFPELSDYIKPFPKFTLYKPGDSSQPTSADIAASSSLIVRNPYLLLENYPYNVDTVSTSMQNGRICKPACPFVI